MSRQTEDIAESAQRASSRIADIVRETPLERSLPFSRMAGTDVYLKLENRQHTGSFKLRGATNRLMTLSSQQRSNGVVAASSGNHGAALAYAMRQLDTKGVIFVPEQTSVAKVKSIGDYGGEVRFFGTDGLDTEQHARQFAAEKDMVYVSPYNDKEIVAGQGTCGIEIVKQLPSLDAAFIAVGGGGLISGVGSVLRASNPAVRIFGCQPEASAVMAKSIAAGRVLELASEPTLSDGTAGGVESDSITFALCRELVDEFVLVSEQEIAEAMRLYQKAHDEVIEGAAGVAIAALLRRAEVVAGMTVAVIICGGNVSEQTLRSVLQK